MEGREGGHPQEKEGREGTHIDKETESHRNKGLDRRVVVPLVSLRLRRKGRDSFDY